jgi:3',5'-cyclic-AMP phosphodiesterase
MPNPPIVIVQITDTHLFEDPNCLLQGINTEKSYLAVLAEIAKLNPRPDLLLLTGDLTDLSSVAAYGRMAQSLTTLGIPAIALAGNHDSETLMQTSLVGGVVSMERVWQQQKWRLLCLSSVIEGQTHGYLSDRTLSWLEAELRQNPDQYFAIAFHHPAMPLGTDWMDRLSLHNQGAFWQICDRYPQVKVVLNGHAHQSFDRIRTKIGGRGNCQVRYLVTPSTCVQFLPNSAKFQLDRQSLPGYRILYLHPNGAIGTEVKRLVGREFITPQLAMAN